MAFPDLFLPRKQLCIALLVAITGIGITEGETELGAMINGRLPDGLPTVR